MKTRKRTTAAIAAMTMALSSIPLTAMPLTVHAGSTWSKFDTGVTTLGTSVIGAPSSASSNTTWTGNYVYYGKYNSNSVKYRVLDPNSTDFKDAADHTKTLNTLFLDCDTILKTGKWGSTNTNWSSTDCDLHKWLNGTGSTDFFNVNNFTDVEKAAIPAIYKTYTDNVTGNYYVINLTQKEKVFPLDMFDVYKAAYGYSSNDTRKKSSTSSWWLRTRVNNSNSSTHAATITNTGGYSAQPVANSHGYSPAFNVLLDKIAFTSKVNPNNEDTYGNEYKLTLKDTDFGIDVTTDAYVTANGSTVTVPYTVTDTDEKLDPDTVSVLIQSKTDNSIIYYAPLSGTYAASGTGTFTLPSSLDIDDWGTDYTVSILAEDVNGQYETDYASAPVEIGVSKHEVSVSAASNGTVAADKTENVIAGNTVTLTVTPDEGYAVKSVKYNDTVIEPVEGVYSFTMPAEDVTVSAEFAKAPVSVTYLDENGVEKTVDAIPLDGTETSLTSGTYVVADNVSYTKQLLICGDVTLILSDGKTMTVTNNAEAQPSLSCQYGSFTIYGQKNQSGKLSAKNNWYSDGPAFDGFMEGTVTINGGDLTITGGGNDNKVALYIENGLTINAGNVSVTKGKVDLGSGTLALNGGTIKADSYTTNGAIQVKEGLIYEDEDGNIYDSDNNPDTAAIANKTLAPVKPQSLSSGTIASQPVLHIGNSDNILAIENTYLDGYKFDGFMVGETPCEDMAAVVEAVRNLRTADPNAEITITPKFTQKEQKYDLTIVGGHLKDSTDTAGEFKASDQLYAVADAPTVGQKFSCWKVGDTVVGYEKNYAFRMPSQDMTLTAVYVPDDTDVVKEGVGYIERVYKPENGKMSFVSILSIPDNCQMLKAGIVAQKSEVLGTDELTENNARFVRYSDTSANSYSSFKYTWTLTASDDSEWTVRPYLVYTDAQGEHTVYGAAETNKLSDFE